MEKPRAPWCPCGPWGGSGLRARRQASLRGRRSPGAGATPISQVEKVRRRPGGTRTLGCRRPLPRPPHSEGGKETHDGRLRDARRGLVPVPVSERILMSAGTRNRRQTQEGEEESPAHPRATLPPARGVQWAGVSRPRAGRSRAGPATAHGVVTFCSKAWAGWALIRPQSSRWRHVVKQCVTLVNGVPTVSSFPIRTHRPQILGGYIDGQKPPKAGANLFQNLGRGLQTSSERF